MQILQSFQNIAKIPELRSRILWTFGLLVVFRIGSHITLPGVDPNGVADWQKSMEGSGDLFAVIQLFSGGALGNLALFSLGIMPYITASIIMQLMTKVSPRLEAIAKEGPSGQRKIQQYTRYAAIPICLVQGMFAAITLKGFSEQRVANELSPLLVASGPMAIIFLTIGLMAGALFIMWLGEQITERGLGNGASVLIMAGIIARMPAIVIKMFADARKEPPDVTPDAIAIIWLIYLGAIIGTVFITQAQRRIPLQHAKHIRGRRMMAGGRNFLPLKVNTAGVMPVIFASSILVIPQFFGQIEALKPIADLFLRGGFVFAVFFSIAIIFFAYFWTYLFFQPNEIALNLKESGSFVPGIRPGENTANYLNAILARVTLFGAVFLVVIALLPDLVSAALGTQSYMVQFLGGTGILIIVGVGLDIINKIESYLLMHHYGGFLGGSGRIQGRR